MAQVRRDYNVRFVAVRAIFDRVDDTAPSNFTVFTRDVMSRSIQTMLYDFLKTL